MKYLRPEENNYIENKGDVLASKFYHLTYPDGGKAISNLGIKNIDDKITDVINNGFLKNFLNLCIIYSFKLFLRLNLF